MTNKEYQECLMFCLDHCTQYLNKYPYNCLYRHSDGHYSADCNNTVKSIVNSQGGFRRFSPGDFANPAGMTGDCTEWGLISQGQFTDFSRVNDGNVKILYMEGHIGSAYGEEFSLNGHVYNCIETTGAHGDWSRDGSIATYCTEQGQRLNHKGGYSLGWWSHIAYFPESWVSRADHPQPVPPTPPAPAGKEPEYRTYDDIRKEWLIPVKGDSDYAGIFGHDVDCVAVDGSGIKGGLKYCVHCWGGDESEHYGFAGWLPAVNGYDVRDYNDGFAGNYHPIDALAIQSDEELNYQVHYRKSGKWEAPVSSKNFNLNDPENGYAGTIGQPIDGIRIWTK